MYHKNYVHTITSKEYTMMNSSHLDIQDIPYLQYIMFYFNIENIQYDITFYNYYG